MCVEEIEGRITAGLVIVDRLAFCTTTCFLGLCARVGVI